MQASSTASLRHAEYYLSVLRQSEHLYTQGREGQGQALKLFDAEWPNIKAAQRWTASTAGQNDEASRLCGDFPNAGPNLLDLRLDPHERIRWSRAALKSARRLKRRESEYAALTTLGRAFTIPRMTHRAIVLQQKALEIALGAGNRKVECSALINLGLAWYISGISRGKHQAREAQREVEYALGYFDQALSNIRQIPDRSKDDRKSEANALGNIGHAWHRLGDPMRAIRCYEEQLAIAEGVGDRRIESQALGSLGIVYKFLRCFEEAGKFYERQLAIARELGDRFGEAGAIYNLGLALYETSHSAQALIQAEAALGIFEQVSPPNAVRVREQIARWRGDQ